MAHTNKTFLVRLKSNALQHVTAATVEMRGKHLVFLTAKGELAALFSLAIVESSQRPLINEPGESFLGENRAYFSASSRLRHVDIGYLGTLDCLDAPPRAIYLSLGLSRTCPEPSKVHTGKE